MLDEFVYGEVSRVSPEAPAPVIAVQRTETNIGGAGNVARNIAALGARCIFVGLVGEDEAGAKLKTALSRESLIETVLVCDSERPTTRKVRFVSEHFSTHMLRADWEMAAPASADIEQKLIDAILPLLSRADIVLLSDYAKGVLTARVIRNVIDAARKLGKRVIVDPKSANLAIYRGATLLKPNRKEFAEATRSRADSEKSIADAAQEIMQLAEWGRQGLRIGFTNGCFDILHPGHVKVLTAARGACDRLVVGLNSDASVRRLKGEGRPVQDERARAEVLAALEAVDLVAIFEEDTPIDLITQTKPSVLVKGGDYSREQVVGYEIVEAHGGEIVLVDILPGHSTTSLVDRARGGKA